MWAEMVFHPLGIRIMQAHALDCLNHHKNTSFPEIRKLHVLRNSAVPCAGSRLHSFEAIAAG